MLAGRGDGIDLDTPFRWAVSEIKEPGPFFQNLSLLLDSDAVLYFEGTTVAAEVSKLFESRRAKNAVAVVRDTIFPVPDIFHVAFSRELAEKLIEQVSVRPTHDCFNHVKAYRGASLLFTFHDAFEDVLLISEHVPEEKVKAFCERLGVAYQREANTNNRDPEQLRHFLFALENPHTVRIRGESWWTRLKRRFGK